MAIFMNIDFLGMFQAWIESPNNRFYPILFVLLLFLWFGGFRQYTWNSSWLECIVTIKKVGGKGMRNNKEWYPVIGTAILTVVCVASYFIFLR